MIFLYNASQTWNNTTWNIPKQGKQYHNIQSQKKSQKPSTFSHGRLLDFTNLDLRSTLNGYVEG